MSVSASATFERGPAALLYLDVALVLILAAPVLAAGAPVLGYAVGGAAWILARLASIVIDRRIAQVPDLRRMIGLGVAYKMLRVWVLAIAIIVAGVAGARADGLTAALVIFGGFSVYFATSAISHVTQRRSSI
ncbi:MAG TPA: hypothetical protein VGO80_10040 [Solirubrobacteraceae bacterium]|nr:hypothetical protein [Solirubrobacteraceae bacterium]